MRIAYLITTYNRQKSLKRLVDELDGDVYIVDDGSKPRVTVSAKKKIYQLNQGKEGYPGTVSALWNMVRNKEYDYYIMLPDDFLPVEGFVKKAVKTWLKIDDYSKICLNLYTDRGRYMKPCWTGFQPIDKGEYLHTQWVDMCFLCEREFFEALNWKTSRTYRNWDANPELGSGVGSWISRQLTLKGYGIYQVKKSLLIVQEEGYSSKMNMINKDSEIYKTV